MSPTSEYEQLDLRKVLAEIDNLRAETLKMQSETQMQLEERERLRVETAKMQSETQMQMDERERLRAETAKIQSEAQKLNIETKWHPVRYVGGVAIGTILFVGALVGILKAFLS